MIKLILIAIVSLQVDTVRISWGKGPAELGIKIQTREDAGPNMGPLAFDVENGTLAFIDFYNHRIKFFNSEGKYLTDEELNYPSSNILLWHDTLYITFGEWNTIHTLAIKRGKAVSEMKLTLDHKLVGNSIEFLKDYSRGVVFMSYKTIVGEKIRSYFSLFSMKLKLRDFIEGDPASTDGKTLLGISRDGVPVYVWFDGRSFYFDHKGEIFKWHPVFYALMDGAPYKVDSDGTLYVVNYTQSGVQVLEVKW